MLNWIDWLSENIGKAVSWLFIITVASVFYEVVTRYVFNAPTQWGFETSLYASAIAIILSGAYCQKKCTHIAITSVYDLLPVKPRRYLDGFNLLFTGVVCFILFLGTAKWGWNALANWQTTGSAWNPPAPAIVKPLIPLTALLISLQTLSQFIRLIRNIDDNNQTVVGE